MKVKFLDNYRTKNGNPSGTPPERREYEQASEEFKKDQVVDLPDASANHHINRGRAVAADDDKDTHRTAAPPAREPAHAPTQSGSPQNKPGR